MEDSALNNKDSNENDSTGGHGNTREQPKAPWSRRTWLVRSGIGALGVAAWGRAVQAIEFDFSSQLIYLSPQTSQGQNSRCQAEIWFAEVDGELFVVTASDAWRARAIRQGLPMARIWVGDVGRWQASGGAYLRLPQLMTRAGWKTIRPGSARCSAAWAPSTPLNGHPGGRVSGAAWPTAVG